jgi:antitoxin YefM
MSKKSMTFAEAQADLKKVMDDVCKDHTPTVVTRSSGGHVVMLSLADYNGIEETLHLLGNVNNARHLAESIAQLKAGRSQRRQAVPEEAEKRKHTC